MKVSWGTGIVIAIISFIAFIMVMVFMMSTNKKYNHDLVSENYYQQELVYQERIDAEKNLDSLKYPLKVLKVNKGISIVFSKQFDVSNIKGTVALYRPSDKVLDKQMPIVLTDHKMFISESYLVAGRWDVVITFDYNAKKYYKKESIHY